MQIENHKEEVPFSYYEGLFQSWIPRTRWNAPASNGMGKNFM